MNHSVESFVEHNDEVRIFGSHQNQKFDACFDGLLIANGARSQLRPKAWVKVNKAYPWGLRGVSCPSAKSSILKFCINFMIARKL